MPVFEGRILAQTSLRPLLEEWPLGRRAVALALGAIGLYRRSVDANARLVRRAEETAVDVVATRDIDDGEEIVISETPPSKLLEPRPFWSSPAVARLWRRARSIRRRTGTIGVEELTRG